MICRTNLIFGKLLKIQMQREVEGIAGSKQNFESSKPKSLYIGRNYRNKLMPRPYYPLEALTNKQQITKLYLKKMF